MDLSEIQPIPDKPVIFFKNSKILIIADLHIGIESQLIEQGLNILDQSKKMIESIITICKEFKPKEIILLGDIKHNIPSSTIQERKDVKNFLELIKDIGKIHIILGNHDGNIKKLTPCEILIHSSSGFLIENIGFVHGHRWPTEDIMNCELLIFAHTHPTIMFTDRLGYKIFEPCWVKGKFIKDRLKEKYPNAKCNEVLIMPAYNPLCGGLSINQGGIMGPFGKMIDIKNSQIYLIDGSDIGLVRNIK
jgi:putative SbcD/Mre11-related phosphoesterase